MKKIRLLSLLLAIVMIVGTLTVIPVTAETVGAWDGETQTQPAGKGTKEEPFLIASAENLAWVSAMAKNPKKLNQALGTDFASSALFDGMYFVQTADIDLGGHKFSPIGYKLNSTDAQRNAFAGHYDGRHYKISNAVIKPESAVTKIEYGAIMGGVNPGGIFGVLASGASVSNINACNIKVGTLNDSMMVAVSAYTLTVAGVIAGATYENASISGCTTDADCTVYAYYAAGGILGMAEMGGNVTQCVNDATVVGASITGGIVGLGFNTSISYCINNGKVGHYGSERWASVGGIMGRPYDSSRNTMCTVSYCINSAEAEVGAISFQPNGSSNRIAVAGIVGQDNAAVHTEMLYDHCYNLQEHFVTKYLDNGNSASNYLTAFGAIVGLLKTDDGRGARRFNECFSVASDYTYDWTAISAETVNGYSEKTKTFIGNWDEQSGVPGGSLNQASYAGIISGVITTGQLTAAGIVDLEAAFETCGFGVSAETIAEKAEYQEILAVAKASTAFAEAPKYVGVQETLDKSAGKYALRFILATTRTDYAQAGATVVVTDAAGQSTTHTLVAEKYYGALCATVNGERVTYTAASFGGTKLMALTLSIDLASVGEATYTVTPFFSEAVGGESFCGRSWAVSYAADGSFESQSIENFSAIAGDTALYTIVYPENSVNAPVYAAVALQYHIFSKLGIKLDLANESSTDADAREIVIVEDETMEAGAYKTELDGNRLIVTAGDAFGFIAAGDALTKTIFALGPIKLDENCETSGAYSREMAVEKTADTRVIFFNAMYDIPRNDCVTGVDYQISLVMTYRPDVLVMNEYLEGWRASGFSEAMAALGYVEVKPIVGGEAIDLGNVLFYNTATTDYLADSAEYISYGSVVSVDSDNDGIWECVRRNTGEFAGKYYDNEDNRSNTAHVASFTDKTTGQSYSVCATHFAANNGVDPQIAPLGNALRLEQVEKLIPFLNDYQAEYGNVVLVGGDYNSRDAYEPGDYKGAGDTKTWSLDWDDVYDWHDGTKVPYLWSVCDELKENGFINVHDDTPNTAPNCSMHSNPIWNDDVKAYVAYAAALTDNDYAQSIDHVYALETFEGELETFLYRNLTMETVLMSSDHKPVMVDFNVGVNPNAPGDGDHSDSDLSGETWQGMSDYAAPTQGSGTADDPYLIERPEHLAWLSLATNNLAMANEFLGNEGSARAVFWDVYFKQTADIDLAGQAFTPIGNYQSYSDYTKRHGFAGIYDGDGYAIKNATINACKDNGRGASAGWESDTYVSGIFGLISGGAIIRNVKAQNVKVGTLLNENASTSAATYGETFAGVIVGVSIASTVTGCTTDADCSAIGVFAGGIVAYQIESAELSRCVNRASVIGDEAAGGIVGAAEANAISYNVNYGAVKLITFSRWNGVGGIIGLYTMSNSAIENAVSNCINAGALSAIDRNDTGSNHRVGMGGIVGVDAWAALASYENCFNLVGEFSAQVVSTSVSDNFLACSGGIAGYAQDGPGSRSYTNCYSVAGVTDVNYFGTQKNDFAWNWNGMNGSQGVNGSSYAGIMTGEMSDGQVADSVSGAENNSLATAFATCHYGVSLAEIEANSTYKAIILSFVG